MSAGESKGRSNGFSRWEGEDAGERFNVPKTGGGAKDMCVGRGLGLGDGGGELSSGEADRVELDSV